MCVFVFPSRVEMDLITSYCYCFVESFFGSSIQLNFLSEEIYGSYREEWQSLRYALHSLVICVYLGEEYWVYNYNLFQLSHVLWQDQEEITTYVCPPPWLVSLTCRSAWQFQPSRSWTPANQPWWRPYPTRLCVSSARSRSVKGMGQWINLNSSGAI